jgi:peptidoglycan/xylan/chitin deacetylase (PgdA/CDA1 family)
VTAALLLALAASGASAVVAGVAAHAVWRRRFGWPPPGSPVALAYHKIGTPELGGTWCTRRQFAAHLDVLAADGYSVVDVRAYEASLDSVERGAAQARSVLLTFDDAFASFADHAWPQLAARRYPALLFVIPEFVGKHAAWDLPLPGRRVPHLDWPALRDLVAAGVDIGSHTLTHRDLRRLSDAVLHDELRRSREVLEDRLGVGVRAVSYPFGRADQRVRDAARQAGYALGFSMCPPGPNARIDRFALRRWGMYITDTRRALRDRIQPHRSGFWFQDVWTRGINAVAVVSASRRGGRVR